MKLSRFVRMVLVVAVITGILVSGLAWTAAQQDQNILRVGAGPSDTKFDPSIATDTVSHTVINMMFPGLAPANEMTSAPEHGMADEWTISDDLLTYTFKLHQGVSWVHWDAAKGEVVQSTDENGNVRYVTAQDFVYGLKRILDPATASQYAYIPAQWTKGGAAFNGGTGSADDVGIVALDDYTLQITASQPAGFLLNIFGTWLYAALPQWTIEEYGDGWTLPENIESYGDFVLKDFVPESSTVLVKNPFWTGTESHPVPQLDEIDISNLDSSVALAAYEAGELDMIEDPPLPDLARLKVERPDELTIVPSNCTYYYGFNVEKPPVDNVHMRRAFSLAIDRQTLIDAVTKGGQQPAGFFTPPIYDASPIQADYPGLGVSYDPVKAQEELQAYFDETGTTINDLPPITLMYNTSEGHALIAQAIQQMWKETLGIEVQVTNQEFQTYLATLDEDPPQIWRLGWCQDYSDPNNWLSDVFRSNSGNNNTNWGDPKFDALVDEAATLTDVQQRRDLYAQAEQILTWDAAAMAPIYFYTNIDLTQTYLNATTSYQGTERYDKWSFKTK
jgi:oligopeptide transport system substrate-binding protein